MQGDQRTHSSVVALRAVTSGDGMTADWCAPFHAASLGHAWYFGSLAYWEERCMPVLPVYSIWLHVPEPGHAQALITPSGCRAQ